MSKIKKSPTEAKRDLESWWFENWQNYVDINADDEEGFIRITPKDRNTIFGLDDLGVWCSFYGYGIWASFSCVQKCVEIVISIN